VTAEDAERQLRCELEECKKWAEMRMEYINTPSRVPEFRNEIKELGKDLEILRMPLEDIVRFAFLKFLYIIPPTCFFATH